VIKIKSEFPCPVKSLNVFLTGATGFGATVARKLLEEGHSIRCLVPLRHQSEELVQIRPNGSESD